MSKKRRSPEKPGPRRGKAASQPLPNTAKCSRTPEQSPLIEALLRGPRPMSELHREQIASITVNEKFLAELALDEQALAKLDTDLEFRRTLAVLGEKFTSPPVADFRSAQLDEIRQFCDRRIVAYCHEMVKARNAGDHRTSEAVYREMEKYLEGRAKWLGAVNSKKFERLVVDTCRDMLRTCAEEYVRTGKMSHACPQSGRSMPSNPADLNDEELASFVRTFVSLEIRAVVARAQKRGGRGRKWDDLWKLTREMEGESDAKIAAGFRKRFPLRPEAKEVDAAKVAQVRYDYSKRRRKQNH